QTCTISGSPAISASGLPGNRTAAIRAGMRISASAIFLVFPRQLQKHRAELVRYTGCKEGGKPAICAPPQPLAPSPLPMSLRATMASFELNKILGALLGPCLILLSLNIATGAIFSQPKLEKPGYEIAVPDHPAGDASAAAPAAQEPIEQLLADASIER